MGSLWWNLPGPSSFVKRIGRSLTDGRNVIVVVPKEEMHGLRDAVRVRIEEVRPIETLCPNGVCGREARPARCIHELFDPKANDSEVFNARRLVGLEDFGGCAVWVEGVEKEHLCLWFDFLQSYQQACQGLDAYNRGTICLAVPADMGAEVPKGDIALEVFFWRETVERMDISVHVNANCFNSSEEPLLKRLKIALITELAISDRRFAEELSSYSLLELLDDTQALLRKAAEDRGWTLDTCLNPTWENGMLMHMEGIQQKHSAILAICGDSETLNMRIWMAQIAVLYPALEQARIRLVKELKGYLSVPFSTDFGEITEYVGLELGHIKYQVQNSNLAERQKKLVRDLYRMRNKLAHQTPVRPHFMSDPEILRYLSGIGSAEI